MTPSLLRAVAGWGLPGSPIEYERPVDGRLDLPALRAHRLVGVAAAAAASGELPVDDPDALYEAHRLTMAEALLLEDVLLDAVDVLATAGIDSRVLKGAALAHQLDIADQRTFGDTDLLVRGDDVAGAVAALSAAGAMRLQAGLGPTFDRRYGKSVTLAWRSGTELDLHRSLAPAPFGLRIVLDDLFDDPSSFELAGVELATLDRERHLLHGAIHLALGDTEPRWGNARDVALLLATPNLDADRVVRLARQWRCATPVAGGLAFAAEIGATDSPLLDWAAAHRPDRSDRLALKAYDEREGRFRAQAWATLRDLPWRDKVGYGATLIRRG